MTKPWPIILALLLTAGAGLSPADIDAARASVDPDANWKPGLNAPGMDGTVKAFCQYQGDLVVGGTFHTVGAQVIEHIARWDGTAWHAFGVGLDGPVTQLAICQGELVAAGDFGKAGSVSVNHIARWDGASWLPLGGGLDVAPSCSAVYRDTLFVGGAIGLAGDIAVKGIARWDGAAWHDGIAMAAEGTRIAVTNLAVAGSHLVATWLEVPSGDPGDVPVPYTPQPVLWNGAGWDSIFDGQATYPDHLAVLGDSLYAAGFCLFSEGGLPQYGYYVTHWTGARWQQLGRRWPDDPGPLVGHNGALYLARRGALYRWTGTEWIVASRPLYADLDVLFSGSEGLYTGGARVVDGTEADSRTAHGLARWDGSAWSAVGDQTGAGLNLWQEPRQVVLAAAGGGFVAAGDFLRVGDIPAFGLVQWDGFSWLPLPPSPASTPANAFLDLDGRLTTVADELIGGGSWIRILQGAAWKNLVRFPGRVLSFTPWRNRLVVGGDFAPEHILIAPQATTNPDVVLRSLGGGLNGVVRASCRYEGSVVASGDFTTTADGLVQLQRIGLWDGASWEPLGDGLPAAAIVLEPFAGGVAAAMADGVWHWDGSAWARLGDVFDGPVQALAVYEGELLAAGAFAYAGSARLGGLASWREGRWQPVGSGMNGEVMDLVANGEDLWVSGAFTAAGTVPSSGIAGWQESRAGVESLYAHFEQDSVTLSWRDPESSTHRSTAARWSRYGYPADPQDGSPLPFGQDGRFPASPGTVRSFRLGPPLDGGEAFFSVFAIHDDGRSSAPAHVQVRLPDRTPPAFVLQVRRAADGAPRLSVSLRCAEPLDSAGVTARLDSSSVPLERGDNTRTLWTATVGIAPGGSSLLTVCASDSLGNEACAGRSVAAAVARPSLSGRCLVPDGRLLVEWSGNAFVAEDLVTVIEDESIPPTFEVATRAAPSAPLALSFRAGPDDLGLGDPRRLGVLVPDGSVQGGVYDTASGRLVIRASSSGAYRLVTAAEDLSSLADPQFLVVAPAVPNPFRTRTTLRLELRARQELRITLYDVGGRRVAVLYDGLAGPGEELVGWDGRESEGAQALGSGGGSDGRAFPSGVYLARVQTAYGSRTVRLVKVR
jgi:trimeric autotransporter adhesin